MGTVVGEGPTLKLNARRIRLRLVLSRLELFTTLSAAILFKARTRSSFVNKRECSGSAGMMKRQIIPMPVVMIPSTKKILRQDVMVPMWWMESNPDASRPPT